MILCLTKCALLPPLCLLLFVHCCDCSRYLKYNISGVCPQIRNVHAADVEDGGSSTATATTARKLKVGLAVAALVEDTFTSSQFSAKADAVDCAFEVESDAGAAGLFAVINKLDFVRKWPNGTCRDYIQIDNSESICEIVGFQDQSVRTFDSATGRIRVKIHIDFARGETNWIPNNFHISLVLTSYFDCSVVGAGEGFSCFNNNERCIPMDYYRDNLINCVVPNCLDEGNCFNSNYEDFYSNLWSIIFIGLLSFCFTAFVVGAILWSCWKRHFKNSGRDQSSGTGHNDFAAHFELQLASAGGGTVEEIRGGGAIADGVGRMNATASSDGIQSTSSTTDLPPSYDILFPDK